MLDSIALKNAQHYALIPGQSDVRVRVYRAGALASLGHNHIIATTSVSGDIYWAEPFSNSRFSLTLPLSLFTVDNAAHRKTAGDAFTSTPSADDKAGTRKNMLSADVLYASRYPNVYIQGHVLHGPLWQPLIKATITLHGDSQQVTLPVAITKNGPSITIVGQLTLQQSDFGITPLSIFGGAIAVQDEFTVLFKLYARQVER